MENITKSIIYGNVYQNRYGKFMPVCSSISDRSTIQSILDYLHETPHFRKYNRIAYAFRVEQSPVVFITQKKNVESQQYDGSHSDETIEGSGEKLLHLLEKFNIRNVFVGVLIQQFNPLLPFETTNYRAIVENSRLLLDQLYKKVVALQDHAEIKSFNDLLLHSNQTTKLKKCNLSDGLHFPPQTQKKVTLKERPNHIYSNGKPQFLSSTKKGDDLGSTNYEIKFLEERCKVMREQFQELMKSLDEKEIQQLKYYTMYDKNPNINQIIKIFSIYEGVTKDHLIKDYNFQHVKNINFEVIEDNKLKQLDQILKANKKLNVDTILKTNRPIGVLFCLLDLKIRFSKTMKRLSEMEKAGSEPSTTEKEQQKKGNNIITNVSNFNSYSDKFATIPNSLMRFQKN